MRGPVQNQPPALQQHGHLGEPQHRGGQLTPYLQKEAGCDQVHPQTSLDGETGKVSKCRERDEQRGRKREAGAWWGGEVERIFIQVTFCLKES